MTATTCAWLQNLCSGWRKLVPAGVPPSGETPCARGGCPAAPSARARASSDTCTCASWHGAYCTALIGCSHSHSHSSTPPLIHSLTHSLTRPCTDANIDCLTPSHIGPHTKRFTQQHNQQWHHGSTLPSHWTTDPHTLTLLLGGEWLDGGFRLRVE